MRKNQTVNWKNKLKDAVAKAITAEEKPAPTCPHRRLALEMEKLGAPKLFQPAIALAPIRREKEAKARRKARRERRAEYRRKMGRTRTGKQYRVPSLW